MKMLCKLQIDIAADRFEVVVALTNAGYTVAIEETKSTDYSPKPEHYWVVVYEKEEVKPA